MPGTDSSAEPAKRTQIYEGGLGPEFEAMLRRIDERRRQEAERGIRNWLLAPTLEIYHALQRGEAVPLDRLRPEAVKRYGLKRPA